MRTDRVDENTPAARLALGASAIRRRMFLLLTAQPDARLHLREIQRRVATSPGTASRELARLVAAGLVEREAEGHQVYFRIATTPYASAVRALFRPDGATVPAAGGREVDVTARPDATPPAEAPRLDAPPMPAVPEPPAERGRAPRTVRATHSPRPHRPDATGLKAAARFAEIVRPLYAGRLIGVFLYGSRARGQAGPDADIEIAVVLDEIEHYGDELERTSVTCAALSLEHGVLFSRVFIPESVWKTRTDGRLPAMRLDAVAV
jgi:uncharacterized protein